MGQQDVEQGDEQAPLTGNLAADGQEQRHADHAVHGAAVAGEERIGRQRRRAAQKPRRQHAGGAVLPEQFEVGILGDAGEQLGLGLGFQLAFHVVPAAAVPLAVHQKAPEQAVKAHQQDGFADGTA